MFVIVVEIRGPADGAPAIQKQHTTYSEIVKRFPGIRFKHVMHSEDDPTRFVDVMVWDTQEQSEAFGVDPEYQANRPKLSPRLLPVAERPWMIPGYFSQEYAWTKPETRAERQFTIFYEVSPGKEHAFEAAARAFGDELHGRDNATAFALYRNLGLLNRYVITCQGTVSPDDTGLATAMAGLAELCASPPRVDRGPLIVRYDY